jgi:hypothetical protein
MYVIWLYLTQNGRKESHRAWRKVYVTHRYKREKESDREKQVGQE